MSTVGWSRLETKVAKSPRRERHFGLTVSACYSSLVSEPQFSDTGPAECPDVSVVVVSYNTVNLLDRMFAALNAARGMLRIETIVVDNASRDGSAAFLRTKYPDIELIENSINVGFGRANNQAI